MQDNTTATAPEQTATAPAPKLDLKDLAAVVQIIDMVSRRGAFEGPELESIGALRGRYVEFLKAAQPQQPAPAAGGAETVPADALPKA